jgi:flagellar biosynthesis protein FlhB
VSEAKTEEATPRRERAARDEGRAWQSRDLTLGATLIAMGVLVRMGASSVHERLTDLFTRSLDASPGDAMRRALEDGATIALPLLAAIVIVASVTSALQVRGVFALAAASPDVGRLGLHTSGSRALAQLGAGILRTALVLGVAAITLVEGLPGVATLSRQPPRAALEASTTLAAALCLRVGLALLAFGVLDAVMERAFFRASLRMSRREVERERRDAEGDPHLRRERARVLGELHRSNDELVRAALVVEGDAVAIALAYDADDPDAVPIVLAIERSDLETLLTVTRERGVPIAHDAALADELAIVPIGSVIPEALYDRVASRLARGGA